MKLSKSFFFLIVVSISALAQNGNGDDGVALNDRQYVLPFFPNQVNTLAGTMGELRYSHFHTGIDIRTRSQIGLPIVAAADGYVNRISVQAGGYGNALYIKHSDGNISVYAHLDNFNEEIAEFVRQEQYKRQKFEINLFPARGQFQVKQGELIAYSGNSGSSTGPHLHFDLRDKNQNLLNPLQYGFHEVVDELPPVARKLAVQTLNINSRIKGEFGRQEFNIIKNGNSYIVADTISAFGLLGLEIYAYDRQNYTFFRLGIPTIKVFINNQQIFSQNITAFSFSDQSDINIHTNYEKKVSTGRSFVKLFVDDGNELPFFMTFNKGKISVKEGTVIQVSIELKDAYENSSRVEFFLKGQKNFIPPRTLSKKAAGIESEISENLLIIRCNKDSLFNNQLKYSRSNSERTISPDYVDSNGTAVFLFDLRKGLIDYVSISNSKKYFNFKAMVPPGIPYDFYNRNLDLTFSRNSLFDTLYLETNYFLDKENQEIFRIGKITEPMKGSIKVKLKPNKTYPSKTAVYSIDGRGNLGFAGGTWDGKAIDFTISNFGDYTLATDTIPPFIRPVQVDEDQLTFIIRDEMSGVKEYRLTVDGKWVLMNYDPKRRLIWSEKQNPSAKFNGELLLKVIDRVGNETIYENKLQTR